MQHTKPAMYKASYYFLPLSDYANISKLPWALAKSKHVAYSALYSFVHLYTNLACSPFTASSTQNNHINDIVNRHSILVRSFTD